MSSDEIKINKMMALGQYIHWADIQYKSYRTIVDEDCHWSRIIGATCHWLAAEYVVIEGWKQLKEKDTVIDSLVDKYDDFVSLLRRCRNAIYHYHNNILDAKIRAALDEEELTMWVLATKLEFERFLFMYPFKEFGMCIESADLHKNYFECIGWMPNDNEWIDWYKLYIECTNYIKRNELNKIRVSTENDIIMVEKYHSLMKIKQYSFVNQLSRLKKDR